MTYNGTLLGPPPQVANNNTAPVDTVATEAVGRQCVQLNALGQYVQFTAQAAANSIVVRYSVPDTASGTGANYTLSLYQNGTFVQELPMTSKYSWVYGSYPFDNTPSDGTPRNFYDEVRVPGLTINPGDTLKLQVGPNDTAANYVIDLVDLEEVAPALTEPAGYRNVMTNGVTGNGVTDDTIAISNCVAAGGNIWFPPGNYLVTGDIDVPANTTIQGAGMWYTTFVGNPAVYANQYQRVRFNGEGNNIHLADFAIIGKLSYRDDSEENDGLVNMYGTGSTISRIWVEHTKVGAWLYNSRGLIVDGCRFRDTKADGINLNLGMQGTIVTNCTTRGTGDDCFAIWPVDSGDVGGIPQLYFPGFNVFTHCTAQVPYFANGCGIYGAVSNCVEDSLFEDMPYGAGIIFNGTYQVGANVFAGQTVAQRCDLIRCGGYDLGWQWRGAFVLDPESLVITNVFANNLNISNSLSYAIKLISRNGDELANSLISNVTVTTYGLADPPYHSNVPSQADYIDGIFGVWAGNGANGNVTLSGLVVNGDLITSYPGGVGDDLTNQTDGAFTFIVVPETSPSTNSLTFNTSPAGLAYTVDGTNFTTPQTFNWINGSTHTIATTSPQNVGTGVQDVWTSWSDGGALSHTITPLASGAYTANFTTQYDLTMNAGAGGTVSPGNVWTNSGTNVLISATPALGFTFTGWTGSGSGAYSGTNNPATVTLNGPVTETASFTSPQVQSLAFLQQPDNVLQGTVITPAVEVQAFSGNGQPLSNAVVTLSLTSGAGALNGTLSQVTDVNGIGHFNNLSLTQPGPKTLTASAVTGSAPPTNSTAFMVIGPVAALAFTTQPGAAVAGLPFGQQPVVQTVDAFGNPTTTGLPASLIFSVMLTNGSGALTGTTSYNIGTSGGNGVVSFTNLAISATGGGNQLVTSTASVIGAPPAGAVLWLDANDPTTLTTNATRVQAWKNKGSGGAGAAGTNLWFTQNTTSLQPWLTNQMNGKPVLTFSKNGNGYGTGCTYLGNIGERSYTNAGNQMTYFVVLRQLVNDDLGWQGPVSFSTSGQTDGSSTAGVAILADGSQSEPYPLGIQRDHPATPMQADVPVPAVNTPFELTFLDNAGAATLSLNEATGLAASNSASILNGISPYTYGITDVTVGGRLEPDPTTVDNGWDGDVAEILVYNTALTATNRTAVESYLTNKWLAANAAIAVSNALSVPFAVQPVGSPPRQGILSAGITTGSNFSFTYATTPGFSYQVQTTTNLNPASWTTIAGSSTNPTGASVSFTDTNQPNVPTRYYRTVSP